LYRGWRAARDGRAERPARLERLVPPGLRRRPLVTVIDGASSSLAILGACLGMAATPLGVDDFGQSGSLPDLYGHFGLTAERIAVSALVALGETA
jgi:pyruvate dehydrogenase E1 component